MNQRPRRNPVLLGAAAVLVTALCCAAPVLIAGGALAAVCEDCSRIHGSSGQPSRCCWRLWSPSPAAVNAAITAVPPTAIHPRRTRSTT